MIAAVLLLASAAGMGISLTLPTIGYQSLGSPEEVYSILGGIRALWDDGTPVLSVVVFAFSIALPLFKLGVCGTLTARGFATPRSEALLRRLHTAGKWSTLDFWVVGLFVGAVQIGVTRSETRLGIHLFLAAMVLGIFATGVLVNGLPPAHRAHRRRAVGTMPARAVHLGATLSLIASQCLLLLSVKKALLLGHEISIASTTREQWEAGEFMLAVGLATFAVLLPLARATVAGIAHWSARGPTPQLLRVERELSRWAAADVLALALIIVVTKLDDLAEVALGVGGVALIATAILSALDSHWLQSRHHPERPAARSPGETATASG